MKKCLQYFWPFLWPNISAMAAFEAVVVVLAVVLDDDSIFICYSCIYEYSSNTCTRWWSCYVPYL